MPPDQTLDLAGRVQTFLDAYGVAGVALLVILGMACVVFQLFRGAGFSLLLLFVSYSLIFVDVAGVNTAAFFVRVLALVFLVLSLVRRFVIPGWAFFGMISYVLLGFACAVRSPNVMWSLQNSGLLLVTTIALTAGLAQYLKSYAEIQTLFRAFVVAGMVWTAASLPFLMGFLSGKSLRFSGGETLHATNYAVSGALLLPFMLWAAVQQGKSIWRLIGIGGVVIMPVCLFLSGTRTAVVATVLASLPLLLRGGAGRTLRAWVLVTVLGVGMVFFGRYLIQDRSTEFLTERFASLSLTGREVLWADALRICWESPLIGHGIGANNTLARQVGMGSFHNAYLSIWCNTGLIGLLLVLSVLAVYTTQAFGLIRRSRDVVAKDAARLGLGFLLAISAIGLVGDSFASPSNAVIATLLVMVTLVNRVRHMIKEDELTIAVLALEASLTEEPAVGYPPNLPAASSPPPFG